MKSAINAIIIGLCFVIAFAIVANAYKYRAKAQETIVVTGLAEKDFGSDLAVWTGSYQRNAADLKGAYADLKADEQKIRTYLKGKGVNDAEMEFSAVSITKNFTQNSDANGRVIEQVFSGYTLQQSVTVRSKRVNETDQISRQATELIEEGLEFSSTPPAFYNSNLKAVKMELLGKASADAKARAETIAENAGNSLGSLKKATMGVFQITGKDANENYSYGGAFNTSSKNKTGSITIRMEFEAN